MGILEVILLVAGIVIFIGSFLLPSGGTKESGINQEAAKEEIKGLVEEEMQTVRGRMQEKIEETQEDALDKAERSLERLTNEKIMAVNEYSDIVLQEIHKNHEEAMFLYDMLNNKHANIKATVSKMDKAVKEAENKAGRISGEQKERTTGSETQVADGSQTVSGTRVASDRKLAEDGSEVSHPETQKAAAPGQAEPGDTADTDRNSNEKILAMYRQGMDVVTIARELNLGVGEVQLVIGLYKD